MVMRQKVSQGLFVLRHYSKLAIISRIAAIAITLLCHLDTATD